MYNNQITGNVKVVKAIFVETDRYNEMVQRPWATNLTGSVVNEFTEVTGGGRFITPANVSAVANNFLQPSTNNVGRAEIREGWGSSRLRYIIELEYFDPMGGTPQRKILQGYTSHVGVSTQTSSIDPTMELYFNNVITLRNSQKVGAYGVINTLSVSSMDQLIRGKYDVDLNSGRSDYTTFMRPEDVFKTMGAMQLGDDVIDLRTSASDGLLKKSRRTNNNANHYISNVFKGHRQAYGPDIYNDTLDFQSAMSNAAGSVQEGIMSNDPFFMDLTTRVHNFSSGGFVTYGELLSIVPELDHVAMFVPIKKTHQAQMPMQYSSETSEHWHGSNMETIWATILTQSLPGLMMDLLLTRVGFVATNRTINGSIIITPTGAHSFSEGLDLSTYIQVFMERLNRELLIGLSRNNLISFEITGDIDVIGETRLTIDIGGMQIPFVAPSFADALFAPVFTNEKRISDTLAYDLSTLSDNLNVSAIDTSIPDNQGGYNGI